jgi:hypothetical protein
MCFINWDGFVDENINYVIQSIINANRIQNT